MRFIIIHLWGQPHAPGFFAFCFPGSTNNIAAVEKVAFTISIGLCETDFCLLFNLSN